MSPVNAPAHVLIRRSATHPSEPAQLAPDFHGPMPQLPRERKRFPLHDAIRFHDDEPWTFGTIEDFRAPLDAAFREPPQRGNLKTSEIHPSRSFTE
jgi:hypothetical protein